MSQKRAVLALKVVLWLGAMAPGAYLVSGLFTGSLGVNPVEKLTRWTGMTALVLLLVSLSVTPVRRITGWNPVIRLRRPLGLFAFFYASAHFTIWFAFDMVFDVSYMWADILERKFITVGMAALVVMLPLAITSTRWAIRKLGKRWTVLHRGAYLAAVLGVVHYFWLVKADTRLPWLFAVIFAGLMAFRLPRSKDRRGGQRRRSTPEHEAPAPAN